MPSTPSTSRSRFKRAWDKTKVFASSAAGTVNSAGQRAGQSKIAEKYYAWRAGRKEKKRLRENTTGVFSGMKKRAIRYGVGLGLAGALAAGYKGNVEHAHQSSLATQKTVARVLAEELYNREYALQNKNRTFTDRILGKNRPTAQKFEITVGKEGPGSWSTLRDKKTGQITHIGRGKVITGMKEHMKWTPAIPSSRTAAKWAGLGLVAGAALGAGMPWIKKGVRKFKDKRLNDKLWEINDLIGAGTSPQEVEKRFPKKAIREYIKANLSNGQPITNFNAFSPSLVNRAKAEFDAEELARARVTSRGP